MQYLYKDSWASAPKRNRKKKGQQNRDGKKPSKSMISGRAPVSADPAEREALECQLHLRA